MSSEKHRKSVKISHLVRRARIIRLRRDVWQPADSFIRTNRWDDPRIHSVWNFISGGFFFLLRPSQNNLYVDNVVTLRERKGCRPRPIEACAFVFSFVRQKRNYYLFLFFFTRIHVERDKRYYDFDIATIIAVFLHYPGWLPPPCNWRAYNKSYPAVCTQG